MILLALFSLFLFVVEALFSLLPTSPEAPEIGAMVASLDTIWTGFAWANHYLPVDTLVSLLGILVTSWAVMHAVQLVLWVLTKLHVLGGSSS